MGQRRFWNWRDDDLTFDLARTFIGLIEHGLYRGFDPVLEGTLSLLLNHEATGAERVTKELEVSAKYGIVVTKQGVIIQEDTAVEFVITPTGNTGRKDIIVVNHNYVDIEGGIEAIYSVIEGTETAFPTLPNSEKQEILGYLTLPPNLTALTDSGVIYQKAKAPNFANHVDYIEKSNGFFLTVLDARGNGIINLQNPINDQDAATKFYVLQAIAASVVFSSEEVRGIIELATAAEAVEGVDAVRAITPATARAVILSRVATQGEVNDGAVDNKFVTPKTLQQRTATEYRKGIAAIATEDQAKEGVDDQTIITPYKLKVALPLTPVVIEIGDWDIEASADFTKAHLLADDWDKVVSMDISIRNDANTQIINLTRDSNSFLLDDTNVQLTAVTDGLVLTDFNATGVNRGHITFWLKKDLTPPTAYISVNAGADKTLMIRYLKYDTPILTSVTKTNSGYSGTLGTIRGLVTLGAGTAGAVIDLQYKRSDNVWFSLSSQVNLPDADPLIRNITGQIVDTTLFTGLYPVRAKVTLGGSIVMYTNEISTDMNKNEGFVWNGTGSSTTIYTEIPVGGYVESVGVGIDTLLWDVDSEPSAGYGHIDPVDTEDTVFTAEDYGTYVLRLTAESAGLDPVSDSINVVLIPYVNHAPIISGVTNSATMTDPSFATDYSIPSPDISPYPYGKFSAIIEATDEDGDLLSYSIVQVSSYNPVTGATGAPVEPPTVKFEQDSPYSKYVTVRGLTSTSSSSPRPYYFKAVVDDGQGGVVEKGFTMNAPPITAPPSSSHYFALGGDTDSTLNTYTSTLVASPAASFERFTCYVMPIGGSSAVGSMSAFARISKGVGSDSSPILVPIGVLTDITLKMVPKVISGVNSLIANVYFQNNYAGTVTVTLRAYSPTDELLETAVYNVPRL